MMESRLRFTLGLALHILILLAIKPTSGLFEASLTSVKLVFPNDTTFMNSNGLKVQRVNRTHVMTGSLEFFVDVSNDYQVVTYFLKKSGNGYKRMPYKLGPAPFCQYYDEDAYFIDGLRKKSNLPPEGTCPWPKKVYTIENYEMVTYFLKKTGDAYKRMPYKIGPNPFCQYFDNDKYFVEALRKKTNFPPKGTCPWPKNVYTFDKYEVNLNTIPPVAASGWRY
ncbi:unnamed protein product [Diamesa hyperborea]